MSQQSLPPEAGPSVVGVGIGIGGAAPRYLPGGIGARFLASLIDGIILGVAQFPLTFVLGIIVRIVGGASVAQAITTVFGYLVGVGAHVAYAGWFYSQKGATPGKQLFGLRVVSVENGENLSFGAGALRDTVGKFISTILLGAGFWMAVFRNDRRALHDLIAGSQVLRQD